MAAYVRIPNNSGNWVEGTGELAGDKWYITPNGRIAGRVEMRKMFAVLGEAFGAFAYAIPLGDEEIHLGNFTTEDAARNAVEAEAVRQHFMRYGVNVNKDGEVNPVQSA